MEAEFRNGEIIFALKIDFVPDSPDAGRVFRSMAKLVDAVYQIDKDLAHSVSMELRPIQLLHTIEAGSLRTWLRTALEQADDDALKGLDWKPLVGQYLVRAKHRILRWLDEKETVPSQEEIKALENELLEMARETDVLQFPSYAAIPRKKLLEDLQLVGEAVEELERDDLVSYESPLGNTTIRTEFKITAQQIEDLLTAESRGGVYELVLLLKKPDYLGASMWEFRLDSHTIDARMSDERWLSDFRSRAVDLRPGDGLRVRVQVDMRRAIDGTLISLRYDVLEVLEVIKNATSIPTQLLDELGAPSEVEFKRLTGGRLGDEVSLDDDEGVA